MRARWTTALAVAALAACGHHGAPARGGSAAATAAGSASRTGSSAAPGSGSAALGGLAAALGGSGSAVGAGSGSAAVIAVQPVAAAALPAGVTARGELETAWTFHDAAGAHYVLFSSTRTTGAMTGVGPKKTALLYVDAWTVPPAGPPREPLPIRDFVKDCPLSLTAAFHPAAFGVTDLDHDGIAEVTFGYELGCRSDVRPNTYKVGVLVGATLYMLRGTTRIPPAGGPSGTFTPDPSFAGAPPGVLAHARQVWERTSADSELR